MPKPLLSLIITSLVLLTNGFTATAAEPAPTMNGFTALPRFEKLAAQLDNIIRAEIADKTIPAFSIALVEDQRVVWAAGFGYADAAGTRPATAATVYRVGSVSKLFTDVAIMQYVARGQLELDAPVVSIDPAFRPMNSFGAPVTLRQLAAHRAGLVREPPVGHYFDPTQPSLLQTVRSLNDTALVYPPNSQTKYSNAGVAVLGHILEQVSGQPFDSFIDAAVLTPLEMTSSGFRLTEAMRRELAEAIMWTVDGRRVAAPTFELGIAPAGNLYSSVLDLAKFASAIFAGGQRNGKRFLSESALDTMLTPQLTDNQDAFGIGFLIGSFRGHKMVSHGGAVYGFSTQFSALPEKKLAVIAAASKDITNGVVRRIADHALLGMLSVQQTEPLPEFASAVDIDPVRARRLDGRYLCEAAGKLRYLSERNGQLYLGGGELRRQLKWDADNAGLVADDEHGYGPTITIVDLDTWRIGEDEYERQPKATPNSLPENWTRLVGEYGWDHNTLFVYERDDRLWCCIEWFFNYPLEQVGSRTFQFPDYGLYHGERLSFSGDGKSQATSLTAAGIRFDRRKVGPSEGETFVIRPVKSIEQVRKIAMAAQPPSHLTKSVRESDLVDLAHLDASLRFDIRYATTNNFMNSVFYRRPIAMMQRPAAEALVRAHMQLSRSGYGLLIYDAYRPWYVTKMFWEATPERQRIFVANPRGGSRHNRGCAVDLTLCELESGRPIPMGAGYDEFSPRSFPDYPVGSSRDRYHRELLRDAMEEQGFQIYEYEWWHFDYGDWQQYPVLNVQP